MPHHILLVEDHEDSRELHVEIFRLEGFRVSEAADGSEGVRLATELLPDVIVTDMLLPGLNGLEARARLSADARTSAIPVIGMTGHPTLAQEARTSGFAAVLIKPCAPDELVACIRKLLAART